MRPFAIIARDAPSAEAKRAAARDEHFAFIDHVIDRVLIAGPLRDAEDRFVGSIYVIKAHDEEDARAFLADDPYHKAGIWETVEIRAFTPAAGEWIGGKIW